jgi:hypothetical protein
MDNYKCLLSLYIRRKLTSYPSGSYAHSDIEIP